MTTYCAEADLVGKGAYDTYKAIGFLITVTDSEPLRGLVSCGCDTYTVRRIGPRKWEVWSGADTYSFGSQWEMLAWFGDRV